MFVRLPPHEIVIQIATCSQLPRKTPRGLLATSLEAVEVQGRPKHPSKGQARSKGYKCSLPRPTPLSVLAEADSAIVALRPYASVPVLCVARWISTDRHRTEHEEPRRITDRFVETKRRFCIFFRLLLFRHPGCDQSCCLQKSLTNISKRALLCECFSFAR